jgi:hypothetical protein
MLLNIGLGLFLFTFPFSPKIPINLLGDSMLIRTDDVIVPLLFLIWLIEFLFKKRQCVYSRLYLPMGVYFLIGLIPTLLATYSKHNLYNGPYALWVTLRSAEYYIIFFLTVNILKTKKQMIDYLKLWMVAAILISIYGIFDHISNISGQTGLYDKGWFYHQSNHMGGYLMMSLILALGLFTTQREKLKKAVCLFAIPVISYVILFNLSRTTYLSTFVALFTFCIIKNRKFIIIPIIYAIVLFLLIPTILPKTTLGRRLGGIANDIFSLRTQPVGQFDSMALHRAKLINVFQDFPKDILLGKGLGFYPLANYDSQLSLVPVSTGVVGSVAFIWLLARIFKTAIRMYKLVVDIELKSLITICIAIYCGVLVHSITSTAFTIALIAYPFWFLTGAVAATSYPSLSLPTKGIGQ